jgi:hypothetical protein
LHEAADQPLTVGLIGALGEQGVEAPEFGSGAGRSKRPHLDGLLLSAH